MKQLIDPFDDLFAAARTMKVVLPYGHPEFCKTEHISPMQIKRVLEEMHRTILNAAFKAFRIFEVLIVSVLSETVRANVCKSHIVEFEV
ncbi:hypothetical protein [Pelagicoccus sp. SDUM812003]|uniref:hypothetical protein n=1 Tax=Pelagicoccus sp. SDUM812003 TaxID=3041267 RepID=UPI002812260E|nr:hypothetical protein [Pelagicoccus sp. SDUM812003]